jgi:DNA-binding XRE family transcriptional regulator
LQVRNPISNRGVDGRQEPELHRCRGGAQRPRLAHGEGLSQTQLASRLGVAFQQIQKYEVGADRIGTGRLVEVAAILGIPIAALFDGTEAGHQGLNVSEFRQAAGLCSNCRNLPVP